MERTYEELCRLKTFDERFEYLKLDGSVGVETFGFDRYINQKFYTSKEWKDLRDFIIVRDGGCDLGVGEHDIYGRIYIHHMNPITAKDIELLSKYLLDPRYLICTAQITHNAIHYGNSSILPSSPITRSRNDTCPWKKS